MTTTQKRRGPTRHRALWNPWAGVPELDYEAAQAVKWHFVGLSVRKVLDTREGQEDRTETVLLVQSLQHEPLYAVLIPDSRMQQVILSVAPQLAERGGLLTLPPL